MSLISSLFSSSKSSDEKVPFGEQFRKKYYCFEDGVIPVNHGSYGSVPGPILEAYQKHTLEDQLYPDRYLRRDYFTDIQKATDCAAGLVDADPNCMVFCANATTAINTVLRSYPFQKGDKILIQSTVYGACGNTVKFLANRLGIEIVTVQLDYPLEDDEVVNLFEKCFKESKIKLAMFDAVTSMPGVRLPFERIVSLCRKYDVLSLVDGAHSVGLISYSLNQLKPDFFTSNLHKWYSTPRGCAFLYVDPKHHRLIHTLPVSHSYLDDSTVLPEEEEKRRLVDRFIWTGSSSFASFASVVDAKKFRDEICGGDDKIQEYTHGLARKASQLVSDKWGTPILENKTKTLMTAMFNVEVPVDSKLLKQIHDFNFSESMRLYIENVMFDDYKSFIPTQLHNGKLYARFSCEVYNELKDYEYAANLLVEAIENFVKSETYEKLSAA